MGKKISFLIVFSLLFKLVRQHRLEPIRIIQKMVMASIVRPVQQAALAVVLDVVLHVITQMHHRTVPSATVVIIIGGMVIRFSN